MRTPDHVTLLTGFRPRHVMSAHHMFHLYELIIKHNKFQLPSKGINNLITRDIVLTERASRPLYLMFSGTHNMEHMFNS